MSVPCQDPRSAASVLADYREGIGECACSCLSPGHKRVAVMRKNPCRAESIRTSPERIKDFSHAATSSEPCKRPFGKVDVGDLPVREQRLRRSGCRKDNTDSQDRQEPRLQPLCHKAPPLIVRTFAIKPLFRFLCRMFQQLWAVNHRRLTHCKKQSCATSEPVPEPPKPLLNDSETESHGQRSL